MISRAGRWDKGDWRLSCPSNVNDHGAVIALAPTISIAAARAVPTHVADACDPAKLGVANGFDGRGVLSGYASVNFAAYFLGNPVTGAYEAHDDFTSRLGRGDRPLFGCVRIRKIEP